MKISSLQTDYQNLDSSSGFNRNSERAHAVQTKCTFCGGTNQSEENVSKVSDRKRNRLVWLMLRKIDERNVRLGNALDVDLKIT